MSDAQTIARGNRAFAELEEVNFAFDAVKSAIFSEIERTPLGQPDKVLNLHRALQNLEGVKVSLRNTIDSGRIASAAQAAAEALSVSGLTRP